MSADLAAHAAELLAPLGPVRVARMFGGHGLYVDDLFIAIVADDRVYLKADALTLPAFDAAGCEPFTFDARGKTSVTSYRAVPAEAMDSPHAMQPWARRAIEAALRARAAKASAPARRPRAVTPKTAATPSRTKRQR
jgi:DNA transformation protein